MKILHTADWHLASPLTCRLSEAQARERRNELLSRFADMVQYAKAQDVCAVLICGDISDGGVLPFQIQDYLCDVMQNAAPIRFFLIPGNHDCILGSDAAANPTIGGIFSAGRFAVRGGLPENITVFGDAWETVPLLDGVTVSGRATAPTEKPLVPTVPSDAYHIVMLHGAVRQTETQTDAYDIDMSAMAQHHIDYLALGHYHSFQHGKLDQRGTWCYPGCPEGRGFDECGDKGFVLLTLNRDLSRGNPYVAQAEFIPFAKRRFHRVPLNIKDIPDSMQALEKAALLAVKEIPETDFIRVILCGEEEPETVRDIEYLQKRLSEKFYYAEVTDERKTRLNPEKYQYDISLRGEFVRRVMRSSLSDEEKADILHCGLAALRGEN
ncbi:MAG: metallophosphoesterase [Clostridia bacterium]|nr:metallophosphoesterase [Clostridia bacterium]